MDKKPTNFDEDLTSEETEEYKVKSVEIAEAFAEKKNPISSSNRTLCGFGV